MLAPPDTAEAERLAQLCATRAEEAHHWAGLAWRDGDITEAQACSQQEISWRRDQLAWERLARGEPEPELVPAPVAPPTVKPEGKKRVYKPRPKTGGHWPPACTLSFR